MCDVEKEYGKTISDHVSSTEGGGMPIYEYRCGSCGRKFETWSKTVRRIGSVITCRCGAKAKLVPSSFGFSIWGTVYTGKPDGEKTIEDFMTPDERELTKAPTRGFIG